MPTSISISFTRGRYHATPWGHHVNEALPEWPPSPWRLLRALVAVWKRKLPNLSQEAMEGVLSKLTGTPPVFSLPPATLGHTRHYMPTHGKRTKVFDAFVSLDPAASIVFHWPEAGLSTEGRETLVLLLAHLSYFGRAESWCLARLLEDFDTECINSRPGSALAGQETVRVLTADPATWNSWSFSDRKIVRADPPWNLLAETADLHLERWSDPPGSRWVNYTRPADSFAPPPASRQKLPGDEKTEYRVARFVLDVAEGRRPLPLVTETLPFAEAVRRQLSWEYAQVLRRQRPHRCHSPTDRPRFSPIIHGKDEHGSPAKSHDHAFYLPTDEDGDGRIDHLTIYAAGHFSRDDLAALDRLRTLSFGRAAETVEDNSGNRRRQITHRLMLVGLDQTRPVNLSVFGPSRVWVSATPYIACRHRKTRGSQCDTTPHPEWLVRMLDEDWTQRGDLADWPRPEITFLPDPLTALGWRYRSLQFRRRRNRPGDDGYSRDFGAFRLAFPHEVSGPISLGYACHFGMGAFRPATCSQ